MNTNEVRIALREKFCAPEYGFLEEVANGTGAIRRRSADALAMGLWPSRGLHLHGFEIKVSRADWLHELKNPAKAEQIARYCHFWWLVVGDKDIVKPEELPKNWGLLVPQGSKLVVKVQAPEMEAEPVGYQFLAAIFRKVSEGSFSKKLMDDIKHKATMEGIETGKERAEMLMTNERKLHEGLRASVLAFEEQSGVKITRWDGGNIGEAVRFVRSGGLSEAKRAIKRLEALSDDLHGICSEGIAALEEMERGNEQTA